MYQNVIDFQQYRRSLPKSVQTCQMRAQHRFRSAQRRRNAIAIAEVFTTAAIGVCVLFCMVLTISMF